MQQSGDDFIRSAKNPQLLPARYGGESPSSFRVAVAF